MESGLLYELFFRPIFNLLVWLYNIIPGHDLGIAIILLTIIIKLILFPLSQKSLKSQKALQLLQPKIDDLKKQYKGQQDKLAKEMMKLYKEQKINPLSSCLPLLIQLPFLFAVFQVFNKSFEEGTGAYLYSFISDPGALNHFFLGWLDLSAPFPVLGVLAGIAQWWQTKTLTHNQQPLTKGDAKDENMMAMVNKQMMFMMPVITVVFGFTFPAGLMTYWLVTTLLTILQQQFLMAEKKSSTITANNS